MEFARSILIVDDEANLRSTLTLILKRAGYATRSAASGQEALECLLRARFDLLFLDLKMPGMDGMELLPQIRRLDPDLPVLILTANASLDIAVETLRIGAYGYLLKPVEPDQIISRVNEIFQEQRQAQRRKQIVEEIRGIIAELNEMEK
jgi:DNA-binding NtrC family response regulator